VFQDYTSGVVLMLAAVIAAIVGVAYLARTLEPRQRVVLVVVFIAALVYVVQKAMDLGILGRHTD
jgi:uncharacterized membrane protein YfcA